METKMYEMRIPFHDCSKEQPSSEGCYLVVVKENPKVYLPQLEMDNCVVTSGGVYFSTGHWDGDEWDSLYIDNVFNGVWEDETFQVIMWASRRYKNKLCERRM
ncbi:MAG: hypothetical protein J5589_09715 [Firmicutes bacterium]|nr:hypothetical protein [Bacillota bacterium]